MWFDTEKGNFFIAIFTDDTFSVWTEKETSEHIDMADTGTLDECVGIYKIVNTQWREVKIGNSHRINTDEEYPLRYSASELYVDEPGGGRKIVGTVTHTDH